MLYDALLVAAISRNLGSEKAPSKVYRGELSSVPDLFCGGRNRCRGRAGGERRRFHSSTMRLRSAGWTGALQR
jgi:hypothetical protein